MPSYINTNLASLQTQRSLSTSQSKMQGAMERLSSGLRINSAKDDAAGFAIASGMDSKIRGQNVAIRNANDAISLSQTAEGAMSKIGENLQRMRELAVQSANGTNSSSDRLSLNKEFAALQSEITRVTANTKFNGQNLLKHSGSTKDFDFQIGDGTDTTTDQIKMTVKDLSGSTSDTGALVLTSSTSSVLNDFNIASASSATSAIDKIDLALKEVNDESINHGAIQNRMSSTIATLQASVESQTAAQSRIKDADFALETSSMARSQILQQAGMAMLSQANQLPQGVMALLR